MAALGWILCGILALGGLVGFAWLRSGGAVEAQSAGRAKQVEDLQAKVGELEAQRKEQWTADAKKVSEDAAKVTDVPSAIDFVRGVLHARSEGPGPGTSDPV